MTATTKGMAAVMIATRRYCTAATTRSSVPNSRAMDTTPDEPPATSESAPVSGLMPRCMPSSAPPAIQTASVPTATATSATQSAAPSVENETSRTRSPVATPSTPCTARVDAGTACGAWRDRVQARIPQTRAVARSSMVFTSSGSDDVLGDS